MAKGLDAATAQELIEHALISVSSKSAATRARPVLDALFELARQSSSAAGKRRVQVSSVKVHIGAVEGGADQTVIFDTKRPAAAEEDRIPIAVGGTGYVCVLVDKGPPAAYVCVYW